MRSLRLLSAALLLVVAASSQAFAAGSSAPFDYTPDPALRTASRGELEARIRRACVVVQARQQGVTEGELTRPCGCYALRTLRAFTPGELQSYRDTGVFNDTGRIKAQQALEACLRR
jgi:hypothetical protein